MASSNANCFRPMHAVSNGFFQGDIPLNFALPLLVIQIVVVLLVTRSLAYLFRHIKQPRVLAEIIGGVLLGPTALGRNKAYMEKVFPTQSIPLLETVATMGLMFFIFMVGLELDLQALGRTGKRALMIGLAGIGVPFAISATLAGLVRNTIAKGSSLAPLIVFMGTPLSISAFSVLVRIMAELGLLSTDVGKVAVPAAAVNDVAVWTLLAVGVAIGGPKHNPLTPVWVLLCGAAFGVVMMTLVRMFMTVIARKALKQGKGTDLYVCITLVTVLVTGLCSDAIGVHPLLGPFLLGLVIPKGNDFPKMIIEKIEDFVTGLMLPLFFASSGLKTNLGSLHGVVSLAFLALFFATAAVGKIVGTFVTARLCGLPTRRALILGFLMNTKGLAVLIVLNVGRDLKALTDEAFAILVLTCLLTSFITFPVVSALSGGKGNNSMAVGEAEGMEMGSSSSGGGSCVEGVEKGKQQLRVMAAAYVNGGSGPAGDHEQMEQYAALVNLIEASRGNKKASGGAPLKLYALRVGELSERWSAIMRLQSRSGLSQKIVAGGAAAFIPSFQPSSTLSKVLVKPLAAISDLDHMHHHISTMAVKKRTNLIILPCLKPTPLLDEAALVANPSQHAVQVQSLVPKPYLHLLNNPSDAPCSLALLIIGSHSPSAIHPSFFSYKVVLLFRGGPDDREALYLACRMADHPGVLLRVIRYTCTTPNEEDVAMVSKQKLLDDQAISKLKEKSLEASSVVYEEEHLQDSCGLKDAVDQMAKALINDVNLVIVGRGVSRLSSSSSSSDDDTLDTYSSSSSSSSLGMFGDSLVGTHTNDETDFHACILVVQQCVSLNIEPMSMHLAKADANS